MASQAKKDRDRRYYEEHREHRLEQMRAWGLANPERARELSRKWQAKPENKAKRVAYYQANKEQYLARGKAARVTNPEPYRAAMKRWQAKPEVKAVRAERQRIRNHLLRSPAAVVDVVDPVTLFERDQGICGICGQPVDRAKFHVDHVIPLARGGLHSYANVQVAHPLCNLRKGMS